MKINFDDLQKEFKEMNYGYLRISTAEQSLEVQRFEVMKYATAHDIYIDEWIEEIISGTKKLDSRKNLANLINKINKEDKIIATEISRFGRSLFLVTEIISTCIQKECTVITTKDGFSFENNIQSKVLTFAFGLCSEIERNLISQRTKEALEKKKLEGVKLGRPKGAKSINQKLHSNKDEIIHLINEDKPKRQIAKLFRVNIATLNSYLRRENITKTIHSSNED